MPSKTNHQSHYEHHTTKHKPFSTEQLDRSMFCNDSYCHKSTNQQIMLRLRILALLLCLCCLNANAQQKMDSAAIARWRKSMVPVPLEEIVKTYRAYSQHLREDLPPRHLIDESAIIQTIGVDTPLLEWPGRVARWKTMGDRDELWIDSIADVERGEADSIAWKEAVHRYGCDTLYAWILLR